MRGKRHACERQRERARAPASGLFSLASSRAARARRPRATPSLRLTPLRAGTHARSVVAALLLLRTSAPLGASSCSSNCAVRAPRPKGIRQSCPVLLSSKPARARAHHPAQLSFRPSRARARAAPS